MVKNYRIDPLLFALNYSDASQSLHYFKNVFSYNQSKVKYILWLKNELIKVNSENDDIWVLLTFKKGNFKWFKLCDDSVFKYVYFLYISPFCNQCECVLTTEKLPKHCFLVSHYLKNGCNSIACHSNLLKSNFNLHFHQCFLIPFSSLRSNHSRWCSV